MILTSILIILVISGISCRMLYFIIHKLDKIMLNIDEVLQLATEETTVENSFFTVVDQLHKAYEDALANVTLPADVQAKIDQIGTTLAANKAAVAEAIVKNTLAATEPPVEEPPTEEPLV